MIAYFDTSSLLPLVLEEPASTTCAAFWDRADHLISARVVYAEARAALARAHRMGRIDATQLVAASSQIEALYQVLDLVDIDDALVRHAGALAQDHGLRAYDAVHLAAAEAVADDVTVFVSGDARLCEAAGHRGLAIARTTGEA